MTRDLIARAFDFYVCNGESKDRSSFYNKFENARILQNS